MTESVEPNYSIHTLKNKVKIKPKKTTNGKH